MTLPLTFSDLGLVLSFTSHSRQTPCLYGVCTWLMWCWGVPRRQSHHRSGLVNLPSVGAVFLCCFPLQLSPSVLRYRWLGLLTCKNRLPYNLYCVGGDVKHCSIQSNRCGVVEQVSRVSVD